jgi:hypothetical protein
VTYTSTILTEWVNAFLLLTMVKRTGHNATLYVQSLSCYLVFMKFTFATMHARRRYATNVVMVKKCLLKTSVTTFHVTLSIQYLHIVRNPRTQNEQFMWNLIITLCV